MKRIGYKHTVAASFTAFVVQAVVNNFAPLLFLTFQAQYGIELSKITVLITANFFIQIFVDLTAVLFVDRIGYRASTVLAHAMCATGLIFMTILPEILPSAFAGLLISVFCYAVGAGLLDITINPIVNSCPSTNSNQLLCLLHSFYCWGSVAAVGISTLFFALFSTDNWKIMSLIWAILPIVNAVMFTRVPIAPVVGEDEEKLSIKDMLKTKAFWIFMVSYSAPVRASRRSASGLRLSPKRRSDSQRPSAIWRVPCSSRFLWACRALCTASSATE